MTLEEEITILTEKWYRYVNLDHHKDRDCHWHIEKIYSYGNEPYYQAFHNGYVIGNWSSPVCDTIELAETILRDKLKNELSSAVMHLKDAMENEHALEWFSTTKENIEELIERLEE